MTVGSKLRPNAHTRIRGTDFQVGSGNVFADLGLENPGERLAKARLAAAINSIVKNRGWTQAEAAKRLDTHQPVISALRHGRLKSLSYDRLVNWLVMLGRSVEIRVRPAKHPRVAVAVARG